MFSTRLSASLALFASLLAARPGFGAVQPRAATIERVSVTDGDAGLQIEVTSSGPVAPKVQLLRDPDRLIIDCPNSMPSSELRTVIVNRASLLRVREGLYSSNPPVTRVVLDLDSPQPYQLIPSEDGFLVRMGSPKIDSTNPALATIAPSQLDLTPDEAPAPPPSPTKSQFQPRVRVIYSRGLLSIHADKATLTEVLGAVHRETGADLMFPTYPDGTAMPDPTAQDKMVIDLGPAPASQVLESLLNGSSFNYVLVGWDQKGASTRGILLSARSGGVSQPTGTAIPAVISSRNIAPQPGTTAPPQGAPAEENAPIELPEQEQPPNEPNFAGAPPDAPQQ